MLLKVRYDSGYRQVFDVSASQRSALQAGRLLRPLKIPEWKWEHITMDFMTGLRRSQRENDLIWVVVDRLTKSVHFIAVRKDLSLDRHADM